MRAIVFLSLLVFWWPASGIAQTIHQEVQETVRAQVIEIIREEKRSIPGTSAEAIVQEVRVEILSGEAEGQVATFENDLAKLEIGDAIFVNRMVAIDGVEYFSFKDIDRRFSLLALLIFFSAILLFISGWHGARALVSLGVSVAIILFVLVPLLLAGYSPVLVSVGVAALMLAFVLFFTHGINPRSVTAFIGTLGAVVVTGVIATIWVKVSGLTGLSSDASVYLNFSTKGSLDFSGLLLGSIIIGLLGVLDDVSITQASVVAELKLANEQLGFRELYQRALRVGRDHIGSLVNTLAFAYIGVALPLVLLLAAAESDVMLSLNQEMVAAELIRILVGSIGLVLAVPFTTMAAAWWYDSHSIDESPGVGDRHQHHHG